MLFFPLLTFFLPTYLLSLGPFCPAAEPSALQQRFFPPPAPAHQSVLQEEGKSFHPPGKLSPKAGGSRATAVLCKSISCRPHAMSSYSQKAIFVHRMTPLNKHLNIKVYDLWLSRKASPYHGDVLVKAL